MRILHTAAEYPPRISGIPEVLSQLSERLARRGHDVHVATGQADGAAQLEIRNGVTVHRFAVQGNSVRGISGEARPYVDFVRSSRWDVVASHCAQIWSTDLLFHTECGSATVFVAHGLSTYQDPAYREYYGHLAEWLRANKTMVSLSGVGLEDNLFRRDYSLPEAVIIPNGVDVAEWGLPILNVRSTWGRKRTPWIVNVSTHSPAKAHYRIFELMKQLRRNKPGLYLTQIGCGHLAHRWNLGMLGIRGGCYYECRARALFEESMTMMLNVSRARTVSAVKEADLMVLTSNWEASPLVILECMAAGTPFVTFDVGCVREHVGGWVVGSVSEMAQAVTELLADAQVRRDLGEQGKRRIAERHDWEVVVDSYEQLYFRLASEKKPGKEPRV